MARQGCDVGFCHTIEISDYLHIKQIVSSLLQDFYADVHCCKAAFLWLKVSLDEFKAGWGADLFKDGFKFVNSEDGFELRWEVIARVTHFGDKVLESVHVAESRLRISKISFDTCPLSHFCNQLHHKAVFVVLIFLSERNNSGHYLCLNKNDQLLPERNVVAERHEVLEV